MKKPLKNSKSNAAKIGAGALAAAAIVAAGGYILWENMGKEKQAKVKTWVAKARKEAIKNLGHAKKVGESEYKRIVDLAVKHYATGEAVSKEEIAKVARDLKAEWVRIKKEADKIAKKETGKKTKPAA